MAVELLPLAIASPPRAMALPLVAEAPLPRLSDSLPEATALAPKAIAALFEAFALAPMAMAVVPAAFADVPNATALLPVALAPVPMAAMPDSVCPPTPPREPSQAPSVLFHGRPLLAAAATA
ncbi:hypothetical protein [Methylobacterium komagatae]